MGSVSRKKYDIVLLGATGYTGKLCAEYITTSLPTDLNWAIAGRSEHKLLDLLITLKNLNPDRKQPDISIVNLTAPELTRLCQNTTLIINTVGPYHLYSSPVIAACAQNGTHYVDATGESPWVQSMITAHHNTATSTNAIIIPQVGVESLPSDLLVYLLATLLRTQHSCTALTETITSLHSISSIPSGGTLATVLGLFSAYSLPEIASSTKWTHSPIQPGPKGPQPSLLTLLLGTRTVPPLGTLTTSITAGPNVATVQRTWGLLDAGTYYGPHFSYQEYMRVSSTLAGIAIHFALLFSSLLLTFPPFRWLLGKIVTAPGQGAARSATKKESLEFRCLAIGVDREGQEKRALGKYRYGDGMYYMTGMLLAECAMVILKEKGGLKERFGGGLLTPACLGEALVERLGGVENLRIETEMVE